MYWENERVAKEGRTILFVSHNMPAVTNLCSRAIWISQGTVARDGNAADVVATYLASVHESELVNLQDRSDRKGSGDLRFIAAIVGSDPDCEFHAIESGRDLWIQLTYCVSDALVLSAVNAAVIIRDLNGNVVLTLSTHFLDTPFKRVAGCGRFICHVAHVPLNAGTYVIDLWSQAGRRWIVSRRLPLYCECFGRFRDGPRSGGQKAWSCIRWSRMDRRLHGMSGMENGSITGRLLRSLSTHRISGRLARRWISLWLHSVAVTVRSHGLGRLARSVLEKNGTSWFS